MKDVRRVLDDAHVGIAAHLEAAAAEDGARVAAQQLAQPRVIPAVVRERLEQAVLTQHLVEDRTALCGRHDLLPEHAEQDPPRRERPPAEALKQAAAAPGGAAARGTVPRSAPLPIRLTRPTRCGQGVEEDANAAPHNGLRRGGPVGNPNRTDPVQQSAQGWNEAKRMTTRLLTAKDVTALRRARKRTTSVPTIIDGQLRDLHQRANYLFETLFGTGATAVDKFDGALQEPDPEASGPPATRVTAKYKT